MYSPVRFKLFDIPSYSKHTELPWVYQDQRFITSYTSDRLRISHPLEAAIDAKHSVHLLVFDDAHRASRVHDDPARRTFGADGIYCRAQKFLLEVRAPLDIFNRALYLHRLVARYDAKPCPGLRKKIRPRTNKESSCRWLDIDKSGRI